MSRDPASLLEELLAARAAGRHSPHEADPDLHALAELADDVRLALDDVPPPPHGFAAGRQAFLAAAAHSAPPVVAHAPALPTRRQWWRSLALGLSGVALLLILSLGTTVAAAGSLPGDTLYPIKRISERLSLLVDNSPERRALLEERRLREVQEVIRQHRITPLEFRATLLVLGPQWGISGLSESGQPMTLTLWLMDETLIVGSPSPGDTLHIVAETHGDGSLHARRILVEAPPAPPPSPAAPLEATATLPPSPTTPPLVTGTSVPAVPVVTVLPASVTPQQETVPQATPSASPSPTAISIPEVATPEVGEDEPTPVPPTETPALPGVDPDTSQGGPSEPSPEPTATQDDPPATSTVGVPTETVAPTLTPSSTATPRRETVPPATPQSGWPQPGAPTAIGQPRSSTVVAPPTPGSQTLGQGEARPAPLPRTGAPTAQPTAPPQP